MRALNLVLTIWSSSIWAANAYTSGPKLATRYNRGLIVPQKRPLPPSPLPSKAPKERHPYWYNPRIHNFGNIGLGGRFASVCAPLATALIDKAAYKGVDVRKQARDLSISAGDSVLDLCCGVGFSTAPGAHGVDTSHAMLDVARLRRPDCRFSFGNAETYGEENEYDVVTVMFACHEMPSDGRRRVLRNALRVARKSVLLVDIHPQYDRILAAKPFQASSFLSGEPYVRDYMARMDTDFFSSVSLVRQPWREDSWQPRRLTLVPDRVVMYRLDRI